MKKINLIIILLVCIHLLHGQEAIITDRPDATEATAVMNPGAAQIESGYTNTCHNGDHHAWMDGLLRIGVFKNAELRLINTYHLGETPESEGFGALKTGMKMGLRPEKGGWPAVSFLGHVTFANFGEEALRPSYITPDFRFLFSKTFTDVFSLSTNIGMEWDGVTAVSRPLYTASLGISITDWLSGFTELYGFFPEAYGPEHSFDAGITLWLIENVQLDAFYGLGLNDRVPDEFFGMGISWRAFK